MKFNKKWLKYIYIVAALIFLSMLLLLHYYRTTASFVPPGLQQSHRVTPVLGPHANLNTSSAEQEGAVDGSSRVTSQPTKPALSWWRSAYERIKGWLSRWGAKERTAVREEQRQVKLRVERKLSVEHRAGERQSDRKSSSSTTVSKRSADAASSPASTTPSEPLSQYSKIKSRTDRLLPTAPSSSKTVATTTHSAVGSRAKSTSSQSSISASNEGRRPHQKRLSTSIAVRKDDQSKSQQPVEDRDTQTTVVQSRQRQLAATSPGASSAAAPASPVKSYAQGTPVTVATVQVKPMFTYAGAVGTLKAKQNITISPEIAGRIISLNFKAGQWVKKGRLLVRLDDRVYRANLKAASSALLLSQSNYERYRKLAPTGAVSSQEVQQVLSQYKQDKAKVMANQAYLSQTEILAPFAGYTGMIGIDVGAYVDKGAVITSLVDRSSLTVVYLLPEKYRSQTLPGQIVQVRLDQSAAGVNASQPEWVTGRVTYIATQSDPTTHSFTVQAQINNANNQFVPGGFVQVKQQMTGDERALVVPESSVTPTLNGMQVHRVVNGKVVVTPVQVGTRHGRWVQVINGLRQGDTVVTTGQSHLKEGMKVKILP